MVYPSGFNRESRTAEFLKRFIAVISPYLIVERTGEVISERKWKDQRRSPPPVNGEAEHLQPPEQGEHRQA